MSLDPKLHPPKKHLDLSKLPSGGLVDSSRELTEQYKGSVNSVSRVYVDPQVDWANTAGKTFKFPRKYSNVKMLGYGPFEVCSTFGKQPQDLNFPNPDPQQYNKPLATTGLGPCVALIYAIEVVSKKDKLTSLGWIYSLCHLGMGTTNMKMKSTYRDMISAVKERVPGYGLIANSQAFLLPGSGSKVILGQDYQPNNIITLLNDIHTVNNVWEEYSDEYQNMKAAENEKRTKKKKPQIYVDSSMVSIDVQGGDLVIKVSLVQRENVPQQQSIDIGFQGLSAHDKESLLREEISEIGQQERELFQRKQKLEKQLKRLTVKATAKPDDEIWV